MSDNISSEQSLPKLVIVASHSVLRYALKQLLEATGRFSSVEEAECSDRAVEFSKIGSDAIFLIYPDANGIITPKLVKQIRALLPSAHIVVIALPGKAFEEANATVGQNHGWAQLLAALETSSHSETSRVTLIKPIRRRSVSADTPEALSSLSIREREVFYLLANGVPNRVIAKQLFVSPRTIETHRARVIRKLGLSSTASIVRYAIRHNLLSA